MFAPLTAAIGRLARRHGLSPAEDKTAVPRPLVAIDGFAPPQWSRRDYASRVAEGITSNPVLYRSVRLVAEQVAAIPFSASREGQPLADHPLLGLLARPNETDSRVEFIDAIVTSLLLSGTATLQAVAIDGEIKAIWALRADRVRVIQGADGWPAAHEYHTPAGVRTISGDAIPGIPKILQLKFLHPLSDLAGLAPAEAAAFAIDIHNTATRWNKALLDNSARPSGALVYSAPQALTPEQFSRLKTELDESFQSARNAGRPMLLEGGLDWKAMSMTPRDMDFMELKHGAAREIALAMGVPPMLLGIPGDNTYANYREANRAFWHHTVVPLAVKIAAGLSRWLGPGSVDGIELTLDLDEVDALSGTRDAVWSRVDQASFLTLNEKRAALGYPPIAGGDVLARRSNAGPVAG